MNIKTYQKNIKSQINCTTKYTLESTR